MVDYISYKGEKYPVRMAYSALQRTRESLKGKELIENDLSYLETMLWFALKSGHVADDRELTLKREDMEYVLDESLDEFKDILSRAEPKTKDTEGDKKK